MVRIRTVEEIKKINPQGIQNPEGFKGNFSNYISHRFGTLQNSYTKAYNKLYDRQGSLFRNTFKRKTITDRMYFGRLICYIHLNPVKNGFAEEIENWPHSSYTSLLSDKPTLLNRQKVLRWFGGRDGFIKAHLD